METVTQKKERVASIDVFRGLTILTMVFVNDLAGVRGLPQWMKHMPTEVDGMTFVDVVFPAFLFIVGMAIPFAMASRRKREASVWKLWQHILIRTLGLLVIGIFMVNISGLSRQYSGMDKHLWSLLMFVAVILVWNRYPKPGGNRKWLAWLLRGLGLATLLVLALVYRRYDDGQLGWLQTRWWGILGLIGWSYLFSCAVYFLFRKSIPGLIGMLGVFVLMYIGDKHGKLDFLPWINNFLWLGGHVGGHASITTAGMIVGMLFQPGSPAPEYRQRLRWIVLFSGFLLVCGYFLRPLYGISKNLATPTWSLYCAAICSLIFAFLYWLVDVKGKQRWAAFARPAGTNPLLAYILPSIFYSIFNLIDFGLYSNGMAEGPAGIIRSVVFAFFILGMTQLLTHWRVRLHL